MTQNKYLSMSAYDAAWCKFVSMLEYKLGDRLIKVNPKFTSQICSNCGEKQKMPLSVRTYICNKCGHVVDRDINAARNILNVGLEQLTN